MSMPPLETLRILPNGYLVAETGGCTCYGGGPYGHEDGCGLEPILDLTQIPGWSNLTTRQPTGAMPATPKPQPNITFTAPHETTK